MGEREGDEYRESHELGRKEKRLRRERGGSKFGEEDRDRGRKEKFREKVKNEKKNGRNVMKRAAKGFSNHYLLGSGYMKIKLKVFDTIFECTLRETTGGWGGKCVVDEKISGRIQKRMKAYERRLQDSQRMIERNIEEEIMI